MTRLLNFLGLGGALGFALAAVLGVMFLIERDHHSATRSTLSDTRGTLSDTRAELSAARQTVINYQQAAEQARQADAANKARVAAEQEAITERITNDYEARLADARARAERLRQQLNTQAHPGSPRTTPMPGPGAAPGEADGASPDYRLSITERLIATEQAIQLDGLQRWIREQSTVDVSSPPSPNGSN